MPFATHDGDQIHYEVYGQGPALVLQHGMLSNAEELAHPAFVEAIGEHFTMIFVDSLAHGQSDGPDDASHYTPEHRAGDIVAVLDAEGVEKAHYFGYSMGSWIGMAVAKYAPERLRTLVLGGFPPEMPDDIKSQMAERSFDDWKRDLFVGNPRAFQNLKGDRMKAMEHCWGAVSDGTSGAEVINGAKVPTLLFCGEEDVFFDAVHTFAEKNDYPFIKTPGNHDETIDYLGHYFHEIADFYFAADK